MSEAEDWEVEYGEMEFSRADFAKMPEHQFDLFMRFGLAHNDLNVFMRLMVSHIIIETDGDFVGEFSAMNRSIIERNYLAKAFESIKLFDTLRKGCVKHHELSMLARVGPLINQVEELKDDPSFKLVEELRSYATFHYLLSNRQKSVVELPIDAAFKLYLQNPAINSIYSYAENVAYHIKLHDPEKFSKHDDVLKWAFKAFNVISNAQQLVVLDLYEANFPKKEVEMKRAAIPKRLIVSNNARPRIFIRRQNRESKDS